MSLGIEFTWYRKFSDGRIEYEFDPETGEPTKWGVETPPNITEAGWLPMTPTLASRITERGVPVIAPAITVRLKPGEVPVVFRDRTHRNGAHVTCKICKKAFLSPEPPTKCPFCGAEPIEGKASPFILQQAEWDEAIYEIGVEGKFSQKFNSRMSITE